MNKKAFLVGFIILLLVAIPATLFLVQKQQELRTRAEPATTIAFDPTTTTVGVNDTFTVNVAINTGANSVSTAEIHLTFDPAKLEATRIVAGSFMPHAIVESTPDNTAGRAFIAVDTLGAGAGNTDVPFTKQSSGPQPVAVITFRAKAETGTTGTQVGFGQETKAFGETSGTLEPTSVITTSSLSNTARVTIGAAGLTPTPTTGAGTPTPTRTTGQNKPPTCNSLTAAPASGNAPLAVTLTANGSDQDNDILAALFTFGDGQTQNVDKNIGQTGSIQITHVYPNAGSIAAQAVMRDRDGVVSATCTTTIAIGVATASATPTPGIGGGQTATPSSTIAPTTAPIPVTGDITPITIFTIAGTALVVIGAILLFAL